MSKTSPIPIPANTPARQCADCRMTIYWVTNAKTGKRNPVSVAFPDATPPTTTEPGQGYSHFADCPNAAKFRRK